MTKRVEIRTPSGYGCTTYVRTAPGAAEFKEVAAIRAQVARITGEFPTAVWIDR